MSPLKTDFSIVIPVFNGAETIRGVVLDIQNTFAGVDFEVILVNDGSHDESEATCNALVKEFPQRIKFIHLARNFGEHNAVLCGLNYAVGNFVGVIDDDGQNPPTELMRLYAEIRTHGYDVVYGRYQTKQHSWSRNLGSRINDRMANVMLKKPKEIYLSSFKVMNRYLVEEVIRYKGAFPYIDGLIFRATRNIGQMDVVHMNRMGGQSNYNLRRLVKLWLDMFLNFSMLPLRVSALLGVASALVSLLLIVGIIIDKITNPAYPAGLPTILCAVIFFASVQLVILGTIGEYLGRLFLDHSQTPQFSVRYVHVNNPIARE